MLVPLLVLAAGGALAVLLWPATGAPPGAGRVAAGGRPARTAEPTGGGGPGPAGAGRRRRSPVPVVERLRRWWRASRRDGRPVHEVHLLDGLAAALEAGLATEHALHVALEPLTRPGPGTTAALGAWSELARAAREGQPLAPSWSRLARRTGSRTAASVARAWTVAASTGAPLAAAVRTSAHAARERHRLQRAVEVATAGARATATVLALLPVAGVGLAALLGVGPGDLYGDPLALASAAAGGVLLAGGHLAVRRMVRAVLAGVS